MKILAVAAELAGVVDKGGVAQYVLGLMAALIRAGHEVRIAIPRYGFLNDSGRQIEIAGTKVVVRCLGNHPDFASVTSADDASERHRRNPGAGQGLRRRWAPLFLSQPNPA
jgi:glycogen synthase